MSSSMEAVVTDTFLPRDPRTMGWPLVGSKQFLITLLLGYVYLVKIGGPRFMKGRKAYDNLKPVIMIYNLSMVLLNAYFVYNFLKRSYFGGGYSIICQGIDYQARDQTTMEFLELCYWYLWVRIADFLDTIFFVLRKKDSHVSFLHVVHHVLVVFNGWFGLAYGPDGQVALGLTLNSFVHVVMYSYYFLSLLGPSVRPFLWWKRYLTQFQLVQFIIMFIHCTIPAFKDCGYPMSHMMVTIPQAVFFFGMFIRFYVQAYNKQPAKLAAEDKSQ